MLLMPSHNPCTFLSTLSLRRATSSPRARKSSESYFYPRSPCGERRDLVHISALDGISIHALLAESDPSTRGGLILITISIHALLAESDRRYTGRLCRAAQFLSTLSLRRATTSPGLELLDFVEISIHALLAESD